MHEELMERLAGWHHGKNMFSLCDDRFHKNRSIIIIDKFLHFFSKVFVSCNANSLDMHSFRKLHKIWIHLHCMSVSIFVEDILPLLDHPGINMT